MIRARVACRMAVAAALLLVPAATVAQEVQGTAFGPHGEVLPGVVVALHRIGDMGGANVASTTTDAEGRFRFQVDVADSATYFAAMRYADRMYIGPPAMAGVERVTDYRLVAEPAAEAGAVASRLSGDMGGLQPPTPGQRATGAGSGSTGGDTALLILGLLALTAAALFLITAPRHRRRRTREAVLELATVENRLAEQPHDDERQRLLGRRHQLRGRLAPRA
jgi:hypothetical protein